MNGDQDTTELFLLPSSGDAASSEDLRLHALNDYEILDTGREPVFDEIAELAADLFNAPVAVVNFIADDRQWFKAEVGIGKDELPLDVSICRHALLQRDTFVIPDLQADSRFAGNPLVHAAEGMRFYAGALLKASNGLPLGTVCVLDTKPRPEGASERQKRSLRALAAQTMAQLEFRRSERLANREREKAVRRSERLAALADAAARLLVASDAAKAVNDVYRIISAPLQLDVCFHYRCDDASLELVTAVGLTPEQERLAASIGVGEAVCGIVAATREAVHLTQLQESQDPNCAFLRNLELNTYKSSPLIADGELLGTLSFGRKGAAFSSGELQTLQTLTAHIATALERIRADERRKEAEHRSRLTFENAGVGMVLMTANGGIIETNRTFGAIVGRCPKKIAGRSCLEFTHPLDRATNQEAFALLTQTDEPVAFEKRYLRQDGSEVWVRNTLSRANSGQLLAVVEDITARVRASALLQDRESQYRALFERSPIGIAHVSLDNRWLEVNEALATMLGYTKDELQKLSFVDVTHPDDVADDLSSIRKLEAGEIASFTREKRYLRRTGEEIWVRVSVSLITDAAGTAQRRIATIEEITAARRSQEALATSEERLRLATKAAGMFVWETDQSTGVTTWSDGAADVIGVPAQDLPRERGGGTFFVVEADRARLRKEFQVAVACKAPSLSPEFTGRDGRAWRAEISIFYGEDGKPTRVFGITQDITDVQRRQEQVRASDARLRGVLDGMAEGFVLMDRDFRILTINAEGLRQDGRRPDEIIGRTHWDAFPGSEENAFGQLYKKAYAEDVPVALEHSYIWPDGRVTWIDMRAYPTPDGLAVFWRDATDRKAAEQELADKATEFEALAENVSQLAWMATADGHIYWYNKRWYDYTGTDLHSMEGWGWREVHHPDHIGRILKEVSGKWAAAEPWEDTYLLRGSDGMFRPFLTRVEPIFDANGKLVRWFGTNTDISDRVATEIRLAQLAAVVEQSSEFVCVADRDGRPLYVNEAGRRMMGLPDLEAACSHHLLDYFAGRDRRTIWEEALQECEAHGYWERELSFRRFDDGSEFPVLSNIFPVKDSNRTTTGYATVTRDLTEKKRIEAELRALNQELVERVEKAVAERGTALAQLHELKKLETIGQLTGGVAHDFNNLLTPIVGALDVVSRKLDDDDRARRLTLGALQAADRARTLIQRLLAFARRQHLEARPVDVSALVTGMTDLVRRSIGPQVRLATDCPPTLPHAMVDPNQLELAILNLAVNAKDAMPGGGELEIAVSVEDRPDIRDLGSRPYVRINVRDSGVGMDEATLARAVEPFFTTKGLGRGTGLGLSSVHGLAAQSGGRFEMRSSPGAGTEAILWLPVTNEVAAIREPLRDLPAMASGDDRTILLVDDEELVRIATAEMLIEAGFRVVQAESAFAAIDLVGNGLQVDALITDHAMPGMTGAALAKRLKQRRPNLPVLMITGYANLSDADADSVPRLAKPFAQNELTAILVEMFAQGRQDSEPEGATKPPTE